MGKVVGEVHDERVVEDGSNAVDNDSVEADGLLIVVKSVQRWDFSSSLLG